MAKIIHLTVRHAEALPRYVAAVTHAARRLIPDNLPEQEPLIAQQSGVVTGIAGSPDFVHTRGSNIAVGYLVEPESRWDRPGSEPPDGSFALFRSDSDVVEVVSDSVASRTVWYAHTEDFFVASTSQRAIVSILGTFEFNSPVVTWMLATGTLGPGQAWDRRIRVVEGGSAVILNRATWSIRERTAPIEFRPLDLPEAEHERRLVDVLNHAVGAARVDDPRWAITLSGGFDSRTLLCLLRDRSRLRAITWGVRRSLDDPASDASVAAELAARFGLRHSYYATDLSSAPVERLFDRFLRAGEGRVDRLSGYADGFALWENIVCSGVRGIIRGDQVFGSKPVATAADVRFRGCLSLWTDFAGLPDSSTLGLPPQVVPDWSLQRPHESLETWRDRLYQQNRAPVLLAALADLKLGYVEVVNPLLCSSIVDAVRRLPDELRTEKQLVRKVCRAMAPDIPIALANSIQPPDDLLRSPRVVDFLRDSLSGDGAHTVLPAALTRYATRGLRKGTDTGMRAWRRRMRRFLAARARLLLRGGNSTDGRPARLDSNRLAFRAFIVSGAARMLERDAASLAQTSRITGG